jgi:C4-type Zn-finger protein
VREVSEMISGTMYCPACDTKVIDESGMRKMPYVDESDILMGWVCSICDSVFDLRDDIIEIGRFDGNEIYEA